MIKLSSIISSVSESLSLVLSSPETCGNCVEGGHALAVSEEGLHSQGLVCSLLLSCLFTCLATLYILNSKEFL